MISHRRQILLAGHSSLVVASLANVFVVWKLQFQSAGLATLFGIWLLLPYGVLAFVLETRAPRATEIADVATTLLVVAGGMLFVIMVVFVNSDAQGGVALLFTPVYQGIAIVILLPLLRWLVGGKGN